MQNWGNEKFDSDPLKPKRSIVPKGTEQREAAEEADTEDRGNEGGGPEDDKKTTDRRSGPWQRYVCYASIGTFSSAK